MRNNLHGGVAGVAQHTWHQEPEQRPAGGTLGVLQWCSWPRRRLRNAGAASLDLIHYTRRAKARARRQCTPVYLSPSRIAPRGCMDEVKGRVVAAWCLDATVGVCVGGEEVST